jgi:predicted enzyme related to lactoylglutathione lyase
MNAIAYFEIQVSHLDKAITFYRNVFGWKFFKEELLPIECYQIQAAGINGGPLKRPAKTPPPEYGTNAFTCSVAE